MVGWMRGGGWGVCSPKPGPEPKAKCPIEKNFSAMREDDPPSDDDTRSLLSSHVEAHTTDRSEFLLQTPVQRSSEPTEYDLEIEEELAYSAAHVTSVLKPVSITMILVVLIVKATSEQLGGAVVQSPYLVYRCKFLLFSAMDENLNLISFCCAGR